MPTDVLPEFSPPTVQIQTEALGLSAVEVEQFITVPLEQDLLNGVPWLSTITSKSVPGLSEVNLVFQAGTDVINARQVVAERLTQAVALPHVSKAPTMIDPVSSTSRVMVVGLSSSTVSLIDLSVLARWQIKPRLQGLAGVANVSVWGQRERQLQVQVDPAQLAAQGVSLNQVVATTGNALWVSPLTFIEASTPGTGGFIETPSQRLSIQHVLPITTATDLAKVPVEEGQGKRLGDVAKLVEDHQPLIGDGVVKDAPGLMLVIEKAPGADTLQVTREVEDSLRALAPGLPGIDVDTTVYRPATYIRDGIGNVGIVLLVGLILVVVLLGAVFLDWRAAMISLVALPLSVLAAGLVLKLTGNTANLMIMAGLVVALGVLIDDIVVDTDHVRRRLQQESPDGQSRASVIAGAVGEIRGPLIYATLIQLVAIAPLFFLGGTAGALTRPLAISFAVAVLASLVVALFVTPALSLTLFARTPRRTEASPVVAALGRGHTPLARRAVRWPYLVALGATVIIVAAPLVMARSDGPLLPSLQDRNLEISWTGTPSASRAETARIAERAGAQLRALSEVSNVAVQLGRAVTSDQVSGVNSGVFWVSLKPKADYGAAVKKIQAVVDGYPGFQHRMMNYAEQRLDNARSGTSGDITVRVYGTDLAQLRSKAEEIRNVLAGVSGVRSPSIDLPPMQPTIEIEVNLAAAERYGLKPGDVRRSAAVLLSGLVAGSLYEDQKVFDVVVIGAESARDNLTSIQNMLIDTPDGGHVPLRNVAAVRITPGPAVIEHDAVSRRVDVSGTITGRSVDAVAADVRAKLATLSFPVEYHAEVLDGHAQQISAQRNAWAVAAAAAIAVLLLLQAAFGSWRLAFLTLLTLLLAPAGGVFAAVLDGPFSLGSLVGLFAVWVLATRNAVQLIAHGQRLRRQDGAVFGPELVLQATRERFGPVVKSTLLTAAAVLPMVVFGSVAGLEILHPMAVVILGGLVTSTLLSLFVLPALYLRFGTGRDLPAESGERPPDEPDSGGAADLVHAGPTAPQPAS
jgi:Cu/Ag efflux pump CusA